DGFELKEGRFRLDIRKMLSFFNLIVVRCGSRVPREVVDAPSLAFKARLDEALSDLI
ncbi:hypothetical protein N325_00373, partial [Colius striatus]